MADCEVLEKDCSHYVPALFGSVISTIIIALSLFAFDAPMALSALWVVPVSVLIVILSYKIQDNAQKRIWRQNDMCRRYSGVYRNRARLKGK